MGSKDIEWDKFDEMLKASEKINADFAKIKEYEQEKKELEDKLSHTNYELNTLKEPYKYEYSKKLDDSISEKYGILTIVDVNDHYEGHIVSVTESIIKVRYTYQYGNYTDYIDVPTVELRENGYYKYTKPNGNTIYICDNIKDPLKVYEIIKWRLQFEENKLERDLEFYRKQVVEYQDKVKQILKDLDNFKKVSDGKITKVFNDIEFGVTDLKIGDILRELPREICLYKEKEN